MAAVLVMLAGCASEDAAPEAAEAEIFGIGVTNVSFRVHLRDSVQDPLPPGTPICFELNAYQKTQLIDFSGASDLRDTTSNPFLVLPKVGSEDWVGTGRLCVGTDRGLYVTVKEYVKGINVGSGHDVETRGPEHFYRVGTVNADPNAFVEWANVEDGVAKFDGAFEPTFRPNVWRESAGATPNPTKRFAIVPKKGAVVTELTSAPVLATTR